MTRRRWILGWLLAGAIGALLLGAQVPLTPVYREIANVFSALQTFNAGINTAKQIEPGLTTYVNTGTAQLLPMDLDFTMATPGAPTGMTTGSIGSCTSAETYQLYVSWVNQSGETSVGAASAPYTPTASSKQILTIARPAADPRAAFWRIWYAKQSESYSTVRACATGGAGYNAIGTTTVSCQCQAGPTFPGATTTSVVPMVDPRDGEIRFAADTTSLGVTTLTAGQNRLYYGKALPRWSSDAGVTPMNFLLEPGQARLVCKSGCPYSTIAAAMASITDASNTKRYTVLVYPGDWNEGVTAASYVSIAGFGRSATHIGSIAITGDQTEVGIFNLRAQSISGSSATVPNNVYIANCDVGVTDGSGFSVSSLGLWGGPKERIYSFGNTYRGTQWAAATTTDSYFYSHGDRFEVTGVSGNPSYGFDRDEPGIHVYMTGAQFDLTTADASQPIAAFGCAVGPVQTATLPSEIVMTGTQIRINSTNAARNGAISCFEIPYGSCAESGALALSLDLNAVDCTITAADSSSTLSGISFPLSANHVNWNVRWRDGRIAMSGGANRYDVNNQETGATDTVTVSNMDMSGNFNGSGTTLIGLPRDVTRLFTQASIQGGDTIAGSTSPTITAFATTATIPAGLLNAVGRHMNVTWRGLAITNAAPSTWTMQPVLDGSTVLNTRSGLTPAGGIASPGQGWTVVCDLTTISTGSSGTVQVDCQGARPGGSAPFALDTTTQPVTVNLTVSHTLGFRFAFASNPGGESVTQRQLTATVD